MKTKAEKFDFIDKEKAATAIWLLYRLINLHKPCDYPEFYKGLTSYELGVVIGISNTKINGIDLFNNSEDNNEKGN